MNNWGKIVLFLLISVTANSQGGCFESSDLITHLTGVLYNKLPEKDSTGVKAGWDYKICSISIAQQYGLFVGKNLEGNKTGIWTQYCDTFRIRDVQYVNGFIEGEIRDYDFNGRLTSLMLVENRKLVSAMFVINDSSRVNFICNDNSCFSKQKIENYSSYESQVNEFKRALSFSLMKNACFCMYDYNSVTVED